ncbi:hypothetical protein LOTGIDRAFT_107662 [Lottia gigantea]|uniref:Methyltransferase type 11 domain-containing protein n=1 Tax=Lottia gigantea TaxID=225164 RepID=V3Z4H7_LOTGI|nr:hypothetical protein LOTGIDRAFT_107662 [Lottia gigantea]ESO85583.1 hypothetical protein LOTGIDRAFT_107662 [Lottia gigantea]
MDYKTNEDKILDCIRDEIRELLPLSAISDGEHITFPKVGPNADCDPKTTIHIDAFLYDDEEIDELEEEGKISKKYCVNCGSKQVKPLDFITNSMSVKQIKYIFEYVLPDLRNKTILDVGSRTGALLYGAFLYSSCYKIFGVEIDKTFFDIQQKFLEKYNMSERIQVFNDDIINKGDILKAADVVIMNNVFEFFMDKSAQEK